jgi:hypothetical protein
VIASALPGHSPPPCPAAQGGLQAREHQRGCRAGGGVHWGGQTCQPAFRFWAQSLIAFSRVITLRHLSSGASQGISSPVLSSRA